MEIKQAPSMRHQTGRIRHPLPSKKGRRITSNNANFSSAKRKEPAGGLKYFLWAMAISMILIDPIPSGYTRSLNKKTHASANAKPVSGEVVKEGQTIKYSPVRTFQKGGKHFQKMVPLQDGDVGTKGSQ